MHRKERTEDTVYSIIVQYQQEFRGLAEYYQLAVNRYQLNRLKWVMERSLVATLAHKLCITVSQVYDRYQTTTQTPDGPRKVLQVTVEREGKRPLVARWGGFSLARNMKAILQDTLPWTWGQRSELEKRLLADTCDLCGSHEQIEVHVRRFGGRDRAHQMVRELMEGSLYTPLTLPSKEDGDQSMWGRPGRGKSPIF